MTTLKIFLETLAVELNELRRVSYAARALTIERIDTGARMDGAGLCPYYPQPAD